MSDCAKYAPMLTARPGELGPVEAAGLEAHLSGCRACQQRLAAEQLLSGLVGEELLAEADRRDFSAFAEGVFERLPRPAPERARAQPRVRRPWFPTLRWRIAGVLAPALAALALIVYFERDRFLAEPPQAGEVDVWSEGRATMIIQTSDGPLVLLGDPDEPATPEGT